MRAGLMYVIYHKLLRLRTLREKSAGEVTSSQSCGARSERSARLAEQGPHGPENVGQQGNIFWLGYRGVALQDLNFTTLLAYLFP